MTSTIKKTRQRARRYWTEDGLPDLFVGAGLLIYGMLSWLALSGAGRAAFYGQALFLPVWIGSMPVVIRHLKESVTYPRTGYVAYRRPPRRRTARRVALTLGLATVLAAAIVLQASQGNGQPGNAVVWVLPAAFFVAFGVVAWQQGSPRYALYAAVALLAGFLAAGDLPNLSGTARRMVEMCIPPLLALGTVMIVGGASALTLYLARNPRPEETE